MLNALGDPLGRYRDAEHLDAFALRWRHPRLDGLETLINDWLMADYANRSAYQVMSAMTNRHAVDPDDFYYSMIGALSTEPAMRTDKPAPAALDDFLNVCEGKKDFSFIYSRLTSRSWRPAPSRLSAILPWSSSGERQSGEFETGTLRLDNMAHSTFGRTERSALDFIGDWLRKTTRSPLSLDTKDAARDTLYRAGFLGCGQAVELKNGYFFPRHYTENARNFEVVTSTEIIFNFGAAGLLLESAGNRPGFRDVGVFVGPHPGNCSSIHVPLN